MIFSNSKEVSGVHRFQQNPPAVPITLSQNYFNYQFRLAQHQNVIFFQPFYKGSGDSLIPLDPKIEREYDPMWPNDYEKVVKGNSGTN